MNMRKNYRGKEFSLVLILWYMCGVCILLSAQTTASIEGCWGGTFATQWNERIGDHITISFPPRGTAAPIWGTDRYTDDSAIGTAAVHAGIITFEEGGVVTIQICEGLPSFIGSERNGVHSSSYGSWGHSFVFVQQNSAPFDLQKGLVGHWKGDIDIISNNSMTLYGGATVANAVIRFDGTAQGQYAQIPHHSSYDFSQGYSVVMHLKIDSYYSNGISADNQFLITKMAQMGVNDNFIIRMQITGDYQYENSPHNLSMGVGPIAHLAHSQISPSVGNWHTVVATYDTQRMKLFLNGDLIINSAQPATLSQAPTPIIIGRYDSPHEAYRYYADIHLNTMLLYTRALSEDEVHALTSAKQDQSTQVESTWHVYNFSPYNTSWSYPSDWIEGEVIPNGVILYKENYGQISVQAVELPSGGMDLDEFAHRISTNFTHLVIDTDLGHATLGENFARVHLFSTPPDRMGIFSAYYLIPNSKYGFVILTIFDDPASRADIEEIIGSMRFEDIPVAEEAPIVLSPTPPVKHVQIPFTQFGTYSSRGTFGGSVYLTDIFHKEVYPVYIALYPVEKNSEAVRSTDRTHYTITGDPIYTATNNLGFYRLDLPEGQYLGYVYDKGGNLWNMVQGEEVFSCTPSRKVHHFKIDNTIPPVSYDYTQGSVTTLSGKVVQGYTPVANIEVIAYLVSNLQELRVVEFSRSRTNSQGAFSLSLEPNNLYVLKAGISEQQWLEEGGLHGGTIIDLNLPVKTEPIIIPLEEW